MEFNHERLEVYQLALLFNAQVTGFVSGWDTRHSIADHFPRAAGSVLENLAVASASYSSMRMKSIEYAIGSGLECAMTGSMARPDE